MNAGTSRPRRRLRVSPQPSVSAFSEAWQLASVNTVNSTVVGGAIRSQSTDGPSFSSRRSPGVEPKTQGVPRVACVSRASVPPWRTCNASHAQAVTPSPARNPPPTVIDPTGALQCGSNDAAARFPRRARFPRLSLRVSTQPRVSAFSEVWQLASVNTVNSTVVRGAIRSQGTGGPSFSFRRSPGVEPKTQGVPTVTCVSRASVPPWRTCSATHAQAVTPSPARNPKATVIDPTGALQCGSNALPNHLARTLGKPQDARGAPFNAAATHSSIILPGPPANSKTPGARPSMRQQPIPPAPSADPQQASRPAGRALQRASNPSLPNPLGRANADTISLTPSPPEPKPNNASRPNGGQGHPPASILRIFRFWA